VGGDVVLGGASSAMVDGLGGSTKVRAQRQGNTEVEGRK
jgi:hypothetical protein